MFSFSFLLWFLDALVAAAVDYDFNGLTNPNNENSHYGLRFDEFVVPLVKAVQKQQTIIEGLQS